MDINKKGRKEAWWVTVTPAWMPQGLLMTILEKSIQGGEAVIGKYVVFFFP